MWCDFSGPAGNERNTDTSFVNIHFQTAQTTDAVEELGIDTGRESCAIITAEHDDGVVV